MADCILCSIFSLFYYLGIGVVLFNVVRYFIEKIPHSRPIVEKAVLITGCDTGFGNELAKKCARNGFTVFAGCLTQKGAEKLKAEVGESNLHVVDLDVSSDESVARAHEYVKKNLGSKVLWGIVNNAGIFSCYGPDDWCTLDDYKKSVEVNTYGVIRVTQAFKKLVKQAKGRIVTVTSVNGRLSTPAAGPYVVAKFAAEAYMDCIRQELHHFDVKCSILEPGIFRTPLLDEQAMAQRVEHVWSKLDDETKKEYGENFKNYFTNHWNEIYIKMSTTKIHYVVDNYYHALTAQFPRHRYYCGWDAILLYIPLSLLPTYFVDFVLRNIANQEVVPSCLEAKLNKKKVA
ncbi:unnamed protein product [Caenorhabditis bovis]|uniref:Uncharacterized protein n=1 Tax=Caenorhabditis bovis TaxID=2654633 RepID=A0A8S1DZD7_9PELO|nr:unnamed protein product [Caenorhabditis bovis]